jgi:hypothetical protein
LIVATTCAPVFEWTPWGPCQNKKNQGKENKEKENEGKASEEKENEGPSCEGLRTRQRYFFTYFCDDYLIP